MKVIYMLLDQIKMKMQQYLLNLLEMNIDINSIKYESKNFG